MKKRILALVCAMTMVLGMSLSVCAAGSGSASSAANDAAAAATSTISATKTEAVDQVITEGVIAEFATTTKVAAGPAGASISVCSTEAAKTVIEAAKKAVGANTFVAAIVDLNGGAGTYTLSCPNVWKGQSVTIFHQKADGSVEAIKPTKVENNAVTFTLTSTSPVAIVIDAAAPKTGDVVMIIVAMAFICLAGVAMSKKARN